MRTQILYIFGRLKRQILFLAWAFFTVSGTSLAWAENWIDYRAVGPFVCRADFSLQSHEKVFQDLADIQRDLYHRLAIQPSQEKIEVYLFRSRSSYHTYLQQWYPDVPSRRALYIKNNGPGRVLVYLSDQLHTDLRHECTHALLHASLPMVPLWLDEGLAEYYEVEPTKRVYQNAHRTATVWSYRLWQRLTFAELETKQQLADMGRNEYRHAWAWVHFMLHGPPAARQELANFLADIREGVPPGHLSTRISRVVPDPDRAITDHVRNVWR